MAELCLGSHSIAEVLQRLVVDWLDVVHLHLLGIIQLLLDHDIILLMLSRRTETCIASISFRPIALVPVRLQLVLAVDSIVT